MRNRPHPHTLREIVPSTYITDPQELVIATALKDWLCSLPNPLRKAALQNIINPTVFKLHPTDVHMDASIMRASVNFRELVEITTVAVEVARQQIEEMKETADADAFYEKLAKYCESLNVETILQNARDDFMEFLCDCYVAGR